MKTFTVTIRSEKNYGALLQAYALQQALCALGHTSTILEYPHEGVHHTAKNLKMAARKIYSALGRMAHGRELERRTDSFRRFAAERMNLSRPYTSMEDLRRDPPEADTLIVGSDQVWRFSGEQEFLPARFLDFGPADVKRISYAASMESLQYTPEQKKEMARYLSRFDYIALREDYSRKFVEELTGVYPERVLDPVFLLDARQWESVAEKPRVRGDYILCYQVQSNPRMQEVTDYVKKITGFRTVAVLPDQIKWIRTDEALYDVSPEEFLGLLCGAKIVVSGSFHGTAFGLLLGKPTYGLARENGGNRIKEIMRLFQQERFCVTEDSDIPHPDTYDCDIVADILKQERSRSIGYLKSCL